MASDRLRQASGVDRPWCPVGQRRLRWERGPPRGMSGTRRHTAQATAWTEGCGYSIEEIGLRCTLQVVYGERGDNQVEGAGRRRILEAAFMKLAEGMARFAWLSMSGLESIPTRSAPG